MPVRELEVKRGVSVHRGQRERSWVAVQEGAKTRALGRVESELAVWLPEDKWRLDDDLPLVDLQAGLVVDSDEGDVVTAEVRQEPVVGVTDRSFRHVPSAVADVRGARVG